MKSIPDVLGYELFEAKEILDKQNVNYKIIMTKSPKEKEVESEIRVVKQYWDDKNLIIVTCKF